MIGEVYAEAGLSSNKVYEFTDKKPLVGDNNYRLRIVDIDGRTNLSHIINVKYTVEYSIKVFPNPFTDLLNIQIDQEFEKQYIQAVLYDILGNQIYFSTYSIFEGRNEISLELEDLETGYYFLTLQNADKVIHSSKVLKQ